MLLQLFSLYFESLIITALLVGGFLGIWMGFRIISRVDKTPEDRKARFYEMIMIGD